VQVGDLAVIRTRADIEGRRFVARVFEARGATALVNAGEADGLRPGESGRLFRQSQRIGEVRVQRVQRGYSSVRTAGADAAVGDAVRFGPPPVPATVVGEVERVVDETLFVARMESAVKPVLMTPLSVCSAGRTVGVAVLLATDGRLGAGLVLEASLVRDLRPGDRLVRGDEVVAPSER
jgi:hypothetical protein